MLCTCWDPCLIGKLLFSCRVPSLSTTLPGQRKGGTTDQIQPNHPSTPSHTSCTIGNGASPSHTDLYSSSLLTHALISREGSLASRLIQDRADMLQMELPSLTTRRLALVSFPVREGGVEQKRTLTPSTRDTIQCVILDPIGVCDSGAFALCWNGTCGHVKEEGKNTAPVVAGPKDPPWGIKGQRQHAARQLTGAPLHLLPCGDVHHLQVVLAVSHLHDRSGREDLQHLHEGAPITRPVRVFFEGAVKTGCICKI